MSLSRIILTGQSWTKNKLILGTIGAGLMAISLAAVSWLAFRALQSDVSFDAIRWLPFAGSILLQLITLLSLPLLWGRLLGFFCKMEGNELDRSDKLALYKAYGRSWLARYIPGRIWMFGGRVVFAARYGIPPEPVTRSMVFELVFCYGILTILGISLILGVRVHFLVGGLVLAIGLAAFIIGVPRLQRGPALNKISSYGPPWLRRISGFVLRLLVGDKPLSFKDVIWGVTAYGVCSCLQLGFIVLLAGSFVNLSLSQAVTIAGAWGLSTTLGYLTFVAPGPGGLGVRDGLALMFFGQVLDLPTAGLIVAVARVVMIAADMVFVGLIELLAIGQRGVQKVLSASTGIEAS
jgi:hypothetical protein